MTINTSNANNISNNSVINNNVNSTTTATSAGAGAEQGRINLISSEFRDVRGLNLFVEATEAAVMSISAFAVSNMRTLAYRGLLSEEDAKDVLELPIGGERLLYLYLKHNDLIKTIRSADFVDLANLYARRTNRSVYGTTFTVHYVGDENQEADCVHTIERDEFRQIIYLTYRGTVSLSDWYQNLKLVLVEEPNPLYQPPPPPPPEEDNTPREGPSDNNKNNDEQKNQQPELIGLHWGFRNYLFGPAENPLLKAAAKRFIGKNSSATQSDRSKSHTTKSRSSDTNKGRSSSLLSTEFEFAAALSPSIIKEERTSSSLTTSESASTTNEQPSLISTKVGVEAALSTVEEEMSATAASPTTTAAATAVDGGGNVKGSTTTSKSNSSSTSSSTDSTTSSRIQVVLHQLRTLKEKYPSDRIFIAGHSLGGALGLITALWIGADPVLNKLPDNARAGFTPINVFTIGNPKPGNKAFCEAIYHLERINKLRCCIVHNAMDPVPMTPVNVVGRENFSFFHPGFRVLLYRNRFEIGRSLALRPVITHWSRSIHAGVVAKCDCCDGFLRRRRQQKIQKKKQQEADEQSKWNVREQSPKEAAKALTEERLDPHTYREYLARMLSQEEHLAEVFLNELYDSFCKEQTNTMSDTNNMTNNGDSTLKKH